MIEVLKTKGNKQNPFRRINEYPYEDSTRFITAIMPYNYGWSGRFAPAPSGETVSRLGSVRRKAPSIPHWNGSLKCTNKFVISSPLSFAC